jgi:putative acetyltransferase
MAASQNGFSVRRYEPSDAQATIDIFLRAIREVASKNYSPEQIAAWARSTMPTSGRSIGQAGRPGLP